MRKKRSVTGVTVYLCTWALSLSFAREGLGEALTDSGADGQMTWPPIVVTATRDARLKKDTPYATGGYSAESLRLETPFRTVPEAMKFEPATMIQKTGNGQGSPYMRGFTGYRNLFMIDGIRLNNSVFRDGPNQYWNTVDSLGLQRIEVVRGPFSALYGSDAVGGTVNAITRGVESARPGVDWDRRLYYRYASAEDSHVTRAETIGKLTEDLAITLGYSYKDFGDVKGGHTVGTQPKTGYDEQDWDAKLEYFLDEDAYIVMAHQSVDVNDAWRTHKTIYGIDWRGLTVGDELRRSLDQSRDLTYLQFHRLNANGFAEEIHAGISHQAQSESRDRLRTRDRHDVQGFDLDTAGAFLTLHSPSPLGRLIYGAEFYHDEVDSFRRDLNPDGTVKKSYRQGPVGDDATYDMLGVYLQDEILLSERLSLIVGGRYEFAQADANAVEDPASGDTITVSDDWQDVVGSARMLYHLDPAQTWNLYAGVSQGFRAPNLSDLTRFDSARTDEFETPSPEVEPEHFVSYELGLKAESSRISGQLAYFYTDIDGMLVRTPTGRSVDGESEVTRKNAGDGYIHGVEVDGRYRLGHEITAFGMFSWLTGKVDTYPTSEAELATEYLSRLMPPTGRLGLRWDAEDNLWFEAAGVFASKADRLSTSDRADTSRIPPGGTPGHSVYDIRAGWRYKSQLSFSLSVENLMDEDFRIHGSGLNEPGRNFILALDASF